MAPKISPATKAAGGEAQGVKQNAKPATNRILDRIEEGLRYEPDPSLYKQGLRENSVEASKMGPTPRSGDDSLIRAHSILKWIGGDILIVTPAQELSSKKRDKF